MLPAQTTLADAQAVLSGLRASRARFEHAIAVLTGQAPGDFSLPEAAWRQMAPAVPLGSRRAGHWCKAS